MTCLSLRHRICLLLLTLGPNTVLGQDGLELRGQFRWGPEVSAFTPCGRPETFWLLIPPELLPTLRDRYRETEATPYEPAFVDLAGWISAAPPGEFALGYDASIRVTRVDSVRAPGPSDCATTSAPMWVDGSTAVCALSTTQAITDCALVRMVEADRILRRYATEVLRRAADPDGFFAATQAWESYRDSECSASAEQSAGGSLQLAQLFGCRLALGEARLSLLWDLYLRNTNTTLPDPATGPANQPN